MSLKLKVSSSLVEQHLTDITARLEELNVAEQSTVVLIGSAVRGKQTWRSDTDFIVITQSIVKRWRVPISIHIHFETREAFVDKLRKGNDFQAWAVRFGKAYYDPSGWWAQVISNENNLVWPDWKPKLEHARKRQRIASLMLASGDHDAAEEEYVMMTAHMARAILLKEHIFPLSRPEMPSQLIEIGLSEDAGLLSRLISGTKNLRELEQISTRVEKRLQELESCA